MKKICLLLIPLLLCSCNTNNKDSSELSSKVEESTSIKIEYKMYETGRVNDDGYYYWFYIDYIDNGKLVIARKQGSEEYSEYKSFPFGKYETIYSYSKYGGNESVYDYGNYAIWVKKGS